jgi:hypothetical protein
LKSNQPQLELLGVFEALGFLNYIDFIEAAKHARNCLTFTIKELNKINGFHIFSIQKMDLK